MNATDPLLKHHWIPRQIEMDEAFGAAWRLIPSPPAALDTRTRRPSWSASVKPLIAFPTLAWILTADNQEALNAATLQESLDLIDGVTLIAKTTKGSSASSSSFFRTSNFDVASGVDKKPV